MSIYYANRTLCPSTLTIYRWGVACGSCSRDVRQVTVIVEVTRLHLEEQ